MTKQHFKIVAHSLKEQKASFETCVQVTNALIKCNENFDFDRFMTACGH